MFRKVYTKYFYKRKDMVENFDSSELLPPEVLVTSSGTHSYHIGLSFSPNGSKRMKKFHNI
jgi:hypothetical protein